MSEQARIITRQELYEAVWKSPMSKLAPQWGSTAAAIVKACEKMNVPRPGSGHWALVVRGWEIERTPLPEPKASAPTSVSLVPPQKRQEVPKKTEQPRPGVPAIKVPRDFSRAHALVKQTRRAFTSNCYMHKGFVQARDFENVRLSLTISREQVDRALRICDAVT